MTSSDPLTEGSFYYKMTLDQHIIMDRDHMPEVKFTPEELYYLQELMSAERAQWFNYYEVLIEDGKTEKAAEAHKDYEMCRAIRDKLFHMNGRDTLAPGKHEQRWWDQQHDY